MNVSNGRFHYFLPCLPDDPYMDVNFTPVGNYRGNRGPGNRHRARTANTSAATCTKSRWHVESLFGKENALQIMGTRHELPQQYFSPCNIPPFENQPVIFIWLCIGDIIIRNYTAGFRHTYPTVDTYRQHGQDIRSRIDKENPLSEFSGITWSRTNIFKKPTQQELRRRQVTRVDLINSNQTGIVSINPAELTSLTLGSFQPKMSNSYVSKLRKLQVDQLPYQNLQNINLQLDQMPQVDAYIWEEHHGAQGPPGWNNALYWPWEDVRMLLTFIPARMKTEKMRSVVVMYKSRNMPPPLTNNMGFRTANMARLKSWICGPAAADSCPVGERLCGCCSHVSSAWYIGAVLSANPNLFSSKHRRCHLLDRGNIQQKDQDILSEVIS